MKKFVFFALSTILFLCCAFGSPHDGGKGAKSQNNKFAYCDLQKDIPSIIPLQPQFQPIFIQEIRLKKQKQVYVTLENKANSTLFYRNFGTSYAQKVIYQTVFRETYQWFFI